MVREVAPASGATVCPVLGRHDDAVHLDGSSKSDWIAFLKRTMFHCDGSTDDRSRLHNLLSTV